ncbi:hypothetical protein Patl1_36355 [Pistacia atlantica]|nr:hypothetical protein Patl1_36355 [Pistacia atlantica]
MSQEARNKYIDGELENAYQEFVNQYISRADGGVPSIFRNDLAGVGTTAITPSLNSNQKNTYLQYNTLERIEECLSLQKQAISSRGYQLQNQNVAHSETRSNMTSDGYSFPAYNSTNANNAQVNLKEQTPSFLPQDVASATTSLMASLGFSFPAYNPINAIDVNIGLKDQPQSFLPQNAVYHNQPQSAARGYQPQNVAYGYQPQNAADFATNDFPNSIRNYLGIAANSAANSEELGTCLFSNMASSGAENTPSTNVPKTLADFDPPQIQKRNKGITGMHFKLRILEAATSLGMANDAWHRRHPLRAVGRRRLSHAPESPRWLVMRGGRLGDAKKVLNRTSDSKDETALRLTDIKEATGIPQECNDDVVRVEKRSHGEGVWRELLLHPTSAVRHCLICAVGIHFFQQSSGMNAVVLIGRRLLLISSVAGMILSLATLGFSLTVIDHSHVRLPWAVGLALTTVLSYDAFFSIEMGPITWVYSSEIFPLRLRAQGASIGVAMNRVVSGVMEMTFLSLYKAISIGRAFFLFAGIATVAWLFFYTMLLETQGKTLEEMQVLFGNFHWLRDSKRKKRNTQLFNNDSGNDDNSSNVQLGPVSKPITN